MNLPYFLNTWIVYWDSSGGIAGRAADRPAAVSAASQPHANRVAAQGR